MTHTQEALARLRGFAETYAESPETETELRAALDVIAEALTQSRITKVEAATLTDGIRYPDNGARHCRWCDAGANDPHEGRCWYLEQCRRADAARALCDRLSAPPHPVAARDELKVIEELCAAQGCTVPDADCADRVLCMVEELRQRGVCHAEHPARIQQPPSLPGESERPREILVGSKWRRNDNGDEERVTRAAGRGLYTIQTDDGRWSEAAKFREEHTWLSDPVPHTDEPPPGSRVLGYEPSHTCINTCTTSDGSVPPPCPACFEEQRVLAAASGFHFSGKP